MPKAGIFCLSEIRDDILMWSHYAEKHTGVCIGLKIGIPTSTSLFPDSESNGFFGFASPITYSNIFPTPNLFEFEKRFAKGEEEASRARREMADMLFLTKSTHWKYEQEWRLITASGPVKMRGLYPFQRRLIVEVVFGCRISSDNKARVKQWLKGSPAKPVLFQAREREREFSLDIIEEVSG